MSGDWIKMRGNLWDDPRVSALVDATDSSEAAVVAALTARVDPFWTEEQREARARYYQEQAEILEKRA